MEVVKFLVFDTFRVNMFLIASASVVNGEEPCASTHTCVHMWDDTHLDGHASTTIRDVLMFRLRKIEQKYCFVAAQCRE